MDKQYFVEETSGEPFSLNLTTEEIEFLNKLLPKGYSVQLGSKPAKFGRRPPAAHYKEDRQPTTTKKVKRNEQDSWRRSKRIIEPELPQGLSEDLKRCFQVLQTLKKHDSAGPFLQPVDPVALGIPDYPQIIKEPIDLGTIERHFLESEYDTANQFVADVNKIWMNSYRYNQKGSDIYRLTVEMEKYFLKVYHDQPLPRPQKVKLPVARKQSPLDTAMTVAEKRTLGHNIRKLPPKYLMGVWNIVSDCSLGSSELIEFDIDTLPVRKTHELDEYVRWVLQNEPSSSTGLEPKPKPAKRPALEQAEQSSFSLSQS